MTAALVAAAVLAQSQPPPLVEYNEDRIFINQVGVGVLTAWAVGNIAVGLWGDFSRDDGADKYFHQGNWLWNIVNLGIGVVGLINWSTDDPASFNAADSRDNASTIETVFLVNAALDIAYMATGGILWDFGSRNEDERMVGYGRALLLQGAFLFAFDGVMAVINFIHNGTLDEAVAAGAPATTMGLRLRF